MLNNLCRTIMFGALCSIVSPAFSSEEDSRAHVDMIAMCGEYDSGMSGIMERGRSLEWHPMTNADYESWGHLIQEIEWVVLASHDPFTGRDIDPNALIQMQNVITSNHANARQYVANAPANEMFGDPSRRLFKSEHVFGTLIAALLPGGYGSSAECAVISQEEPPEAFLGLFSGLEEIPPTNSVLKVATIRGVIYPKDSDSPRRVFLIREFDADRLAAFTDYQMNTAHSFELRLFSEENGS